MWSSLEEIDSGIASLEKGLGQVDGAIAALDGMKSKVSGSDTADGIAAKTMTITTAITGVQTQPGAAITTGIQ